MMLKIGVKTMPFKKINVNKEINNLKLNNSDFSKAWDESREEYKLISEIVRIRKQEGMSQSELARRSGNKQQSISRIENRENSPTLKTLCSILNVLGYELKIEIKRK